MIKFLFPLLVFSSAALASDPGPTYRMFNNTASDFIEHLLIGGEVVDVISVGAGTSYDWVNPDPDAAGAPAVLQIYAPYEGDPVDPPVASIDLGPVGSDLEITWASSGNGVPQLTATPADIPEPTDDEDGSSDSGSQGRLSVSTQWEWWFRGFSLGIGFCVLGAFVRLIRAAKGSTSLEL